MQVTFAYSITMAPRSLKDFKGEVVVVFFGFTQCPDVCPTTLAEIVQAKSNGPGRRQASSDSRHLSTPNGTTRRC